MYPLPPPESRGEQTAAFGNFASLSVVKNLRAILVAINEGYQSPDGCGEDLPSSGSRAVVVVSLGLLKSKKVRPKPRLPLCHMRSLGRLRFRDVVFWGLEHGGLGNGVAGSAV